MFISSFMEMKNIPQSAENFFLTEFIFDLQTNRGLAKPNNPLRLLRLFTYFFFKNYIPDFWIRMVD